MKNLTFLFVLLFIIGCTKYNETVTSDTDEILPLSRMAGDGAYDVLGFGYDVIGEYLSPKSIKDAVIDINKLKNDHLGLLYSNSTTTGYNKYKYGYDSKDYLKDITTEYKMKLELKTVDQAFSATINNNKYNQNKNSYSNKYSYASCDIVKNVRRIYVSASIDLLKTYLNPYFSADLNTLSPKDIIRKYGTHVLVDFNIGGRLNLTYKSAIYSTKDVSIKKRYVQAGFNVLLKNMNISPDLTINNESITEKAKENRSKTLYIEYYGGEGSGTSYNLETGTPSINAHQWESSVNKNNAALSEINTAYPLSDFVTDPVKKEQIKKAIDDYIRDGQLEITNLVPVFDNGDVRGATREPLDFEYIYKESTGRGGESIISESKLLGYLFVTQEPGTVPLYKYGGHERPKTRNGREGYEGGRDYSGGRGSSGDSRSNNTPYIYTIEYKGNYIEDSKFDSILGYCYPNRVAFSNEIKLNWGIGAANRGEAGPQCGEINLV